MKLVILPLFFLLAACDVRYSVSSVESVNTIKDGGFEVSMSSDKDQLTVNIDGLDITTKEDAINFVQSNIPLDLLSCGAQERLAEVNELPESSKYSLKVTISCANKEQ